MRAGMATPLLETKLHAPRSRQRLVERPRLADHMGRAPGAKLTLVSAPPGLGKTTLVADWLASGGSGMSAAWVSLDATESDRVSFWRYVVAAIRAASPKLGDGPLAALEAAPPQVEEN